MRWEGIDAPLVVAMSVMPHWSDSGHYAQEFLGFAQVEPEDTCA
jgi:hypothetical protein